MTNAEKICGLYDEMREILEDYEKNTNSLLTCGVDEVLMFLEKRQVCADKIDVINNRILDLCSLDETGMTKKASDNSCSRDELDEDLVIVFDARQSVNPIVNRVKKKDLQIIDRIAVEKEKLMRKIRENNKSNAAKASKYSTYTSASQNSVFIPPKKSKSV